MTASCRYCGSMQNITRRSDLPDDEGEAVACCLECRLLVEAGPASTRLQAMRLLLRQYSDRLMWEEDGARALELIDKIRWLASGTESEQLQANGNTDTAAELPSVQAAVAGAPACARGAGRPLITVAEAERFTPAEVGLYLLDREEHLPVLLDPDYPELCSDLVLAVRPDVLAELCANRRMLEWSWELGSAALLHCSLHTFIRCLPFIPEISLTVRLALHSAYMKTLAYKGPTGRPAGTAPPRDFAPYKRLRSLWAAVPNLDLVRKLSQEEIDVVLESAVVMPKLEDELGVALAAGFWGLRELAAISSDADEFAARIGSTDGVQLRPADLVRAALFFRSVGIAEAREFRRTVFRLSRRVVNQHHGRRPAERRNAGETAT